MQVQTETLQEMAPVEPLPIRRIHHVELYVGNAKQASYFYRRAFGFELIGFAGPETGVRETASYVLRQNKVTLVVTAPVVSSHPIAEWLVKHGDGVRDVAFEVEDAEFCYRKALERGARGVREPTVLEDEYGKVTIAAIATYGDVIHSFIQRDSYAGTFLPPYKPTPKDELAQPVGFKHIDHVVGNVGWNQMNEFVAFYNRVFGFQRFVSFDDKDISTEYSALRSTVVANENKWIKFPINEPAEGKRRSQIEEFILYNNGPGVQHIALECENIVHTVRQLKANGVEFLYTPTTYYDVLEERVGKIDEDIDSLRELNILVDRDDKGYMLQIFTKPVQDRPTLFYEIIQRKGAESFGKGNFKALFEAIEREQALRGNL
jgi:4-hydroxyphenylpyruvate dioxygenase